MSYKNGFCNNLLVVLVFFCGFHRFCMGFYRFSWVFMGFASVLLKFKCLHPPISGISTSGGLGGPQEVAEASDIPDTDRSR